jgi:DNA-binding HxlR family transcriptional regulator
MRGYGQFCPVARGAEVFAERWTPLVLRELLCGSTRFNDLHRGVPLMSRTLLGHRLRQLEDIGVVARKLGSRGPEYHLTAAGEISLRSSNVWAHGLSGGSAPLLTTISSTRVCCYGTCAVTWRWMPFRPVESRCNLTFPTRRRRNVHGGSSAKLGMSTFARPIRGSRSVFMLQPICEP